MNYSEILSDVIGKSFAVNAAPELTLKILDVRKEQDGCFYVVVAWSDDSAARSKLLGAGHVTRWIRDGYWVPVPETPTRPIPTRPLARVGDLWSMEGLAPWRIDSLESPDGSNWIPISQPDGNGSRRVSLMYLDKNGSPASNGWQLMAYVRGRHEEVDYSQRLDYSQMPQVTPTSPSFEEIPPSSLEALSARGPRWTRDGFDQCQGPAYNKWRRFLAASHEQAIVKARRESVKLSDITVTIKGASGGLIGLTEQEVDNYLRKCSDLEWPK